MPVMLVPANDAVIPTKRVTMPDWDADPASSTYEYVEILTYLRQETLDQARTAATRTTMQGGRTTETLDLPTYFRRLFDIQVRGWRLLDERGAEIPFTAEMLARLPWGPQSWLHEQILACNGVVPTRALLVPTESGQILDYFRPHDGMGAGAAHAVPDPV